jgi:hypothetical protein
MPKKSKRKRTADIRIPDSLKKKSLCAHCQKYIAGTVKDPVISAPSLGTGVYHYKCAVEIWKQQKSEKISS